MRARTRRIESGLYVHLASGWTVVDFRQEYGHGWGWIAVGETQRDAFDPVATKAQILDQLDEALAGGAIRRIEAAA